MNFNDHLNLIGKHAFLSPSGYSWLNYSAEKLDTRYVNSWATTIGSGFHDICRRAIAYQIPLRKSDKRMISLELMDIYGVPRNVLASIENLDSIVNNACRYVKDAIGYRMIPEQPLYFSENCFGTADAISFNKNLLRIHDLKTGTTPAKIEQLDIYAALFCLEYSKSPKNISMELRIYQSEDVIVETPDPDDILEIMSTIKEFDNSIKWYKANE